MKTQKKMVQAEFSSYLGNSNDSERKTLYNFRNIATHISFFDFFVV